jgi:hypothetical protein
MLMKLNIKDLSSQATTMMGEKIQYRVLKPDESDVNSVGSQNLYET